MGSFFVVDERDVLESRGLEAIDFGSASEIRRMVSGVPDFAPEKMEEEVLSSIVTVVVVDESEYDSGKVQV